LKPEFVRLAQREYDRWEGGIGLCDVIEGVIRNCIDENIPNAKTSQQTKNFLHYWTRVWMGKECYDVDIPFGKYETYDYKKKAYGGFIKIPNVVFTPRDIFIYRSNKMSLKTPWELKKSYVPNKADRYYTESIDFAKVKTTKGPINGDGIQIVPNRIVFESPDYNYSKFNNKDAQIEKLKWREEVGELNISISAQLPNAKTQDGYIDAVSSYDHPEFILFV
jgi:hypothetical protein